MMSSENFVKNLAPDFAAICGPRTTGAAVPRLLARPVTAEFMQDAPATTTMSPKVVVLSGGTATNELVSVFASVADAVSYILPISDNGGSTSELIRVIGGPAIGDIRSRLTRLIPQNHVALQRMLSFRLAADPRVAKTQWNDIVDGSHPLWRDIEPSLREIVRAFCIHVDVELLKRSKHQASALTTKKQFRYEMANVGNLFLTGARLFIGSLDSSIELFARLTGIDPNVEVLPCINTNFTYHISALLKNGLIITGQSQISHPSEAPAADNYPPPINTTRPSSPTEKFTTDYFSAPRDLSAPIANITTVSHHLGDTSDFSETSDDEETGNVPQYTHPELKKSQLYFSKTDNIQPLLSPIERIFYVSPYGEEIRPAAHHKVTTTITHADVVVYSIGSLMTSILPIVVLRGVGKAIAANGGAKKRILLLNGNHDRETFGMDAADFLQAIAEAASYSFRHNDANALEWNRFVTHLFFMAHPKIAVDVQAIEARGVVCVEVDRQAPDKDYFDAADLEKKLKLVAGQ